MEEQFLKRINWKRDIKELVEIVCKEFSLGEYSTHDIITIGYEDLNIKLTTSNGTYLVKIFGSFRDYDNCVRYVDIMKKVVESGISHPKLYTAGDKYLYSYDENLMLCVMEFINGSSFYDLNARPTINEAKVLIEEASKINSMDIQTEDYYDEWSPVNLVNEFKLKSKYLEENDRKSIRALIEPFSKLNIASLPHAFVHGDIIRPNVLKDENSKIYIIDFSCSSIKPRVQEMAILLCGMFFNEEDPSDFNKFYELVLNEYRPELKEEEKSVLSLFVKAGFSMYVLQGIYTKKVKGIDHKENDYWIRLGQIGLKYLS